MGTDLENVLEDIDTLKEHLEYLATCVGNKDRQKDIDTHIEQLKNLAILINKR